MSVKLFTYLVLPLVNFVFWFNLGFHPQHPGREELKCPKLEPILVEEPCPLVSDNFRNNEVEITDENSMSENIRDRLATASHIVPNLTWYDDGFEFGDYRTEDLAPINYHSGTFVVNYHGHPCETFIHAIVSKKQPCFAVAPSKIGPAAYNLLRFAKITKVQGKDVEKLRLEDGTIVPTGFFREVAKEKGRVRQKEKMGPFFKHFTSIELHLNGILAKAGLNKGDDVVLMVVNDGEIDLFLNFVCSCRAHGITTSNIVVFAGSSAIVPLIRATGATGIYHEEFAYVNKDPSFGYLDRIFVDMMWYKSFSLWMLLRAGFNVCFQDVDLVWFRDPFPYFRDYIANATAEANRIRAAGGRDTHPSQHPEGFFSDDGQRTLRYTPFFANSGFFYLLANERTEYFAYSVLTAFDLIATHGSHQNVFTNRLEEGLDLTRIHPKVLSLRDFPTGVQYHHNKPYMEEFRTGKVKPYNFHMCWTAGKADKIKYFKLALMWFLKPALHLRDLRPGKGKVAQEIIATAESGVPISKQWDILTKKICNVMPGAPGGGSLP
jgi:hypothetical protein